MRTTFLIGNGFDIGLGMKTRFKDMYVGYVETPSKSRCIEKFKEDLKKDAPKYETWCDFEMGMAKYAGSIYNGDEFVECVRDFKIYMVNHLQQEQQKFLDGIRKIDKYKWLCYEEIEKSITDFYRGQSQNVIADVQEMNMKYPGREYNFINFNYTTVLDNILEWHDSNTYAINIRRNMVHIHGTIGEDVVLGIDNEKQFGSIFFPINKKVQRAFVKPMFNEMYDKKRVAAAVDMIDNSHVICVYGMSLGESDRSWTNKLIAWLESDETHQLICFDYNMDIYNMCNRDEMMDIEDDKKEKLLKRISNSKEEADQIFDQVHIPIAYDIFNFGDIIPKEK